MDRGLKVRAVSVSSRKGRAGTKAEVLISFGEVCGAGACVLAESIVFGGGCGVLVSWAPEHRLPYLN